ncbi:MAG: fibronectin type III domain-containing protein [Patescibacteria group bacterium]
MNQYKHRIFYIILTGSIIHFLAFSYADAAVNSLDSVRQMVKGIYALGSYGKLFSPSVAENPYVDGLAIRTVWELIEPLEGQYNWSFIDAAINQAQMLGKKASLSIAAGKHTPDWVYNYGIQTFRFIDGNPYHKNDFCNEIIIPVPYDPIYLAKWKNFVRAFGARYNSNPIIVKIRITGVNESTAETILPHRFGGPIPDCDKNYYDDIQNWINAGYTASLIKNTWLDIAKAFHSAFPDKGLSVATYEPSFPKINDFGKYDKNLNLVNDIFNMGIANIGPAFIPEHNSLSAFYASNDVKKYVPNSIIGFQMLWWVTGDDVYRMNQRIVGDPKTIFKTAVEKGINAGTSYLEIYTADINNSSFQDVLREAQKQILTVPRIFNVGTSTLAIDSAVISWNTYESSNSQVEYGASGAYGFLSFLDFTLKINHLITLSNLIPATKYNYLVRSVDVFGNLAKSLDFAFTTLPDNISPLSPIGLNIR